MSRFLNDAMTHRPQHSNGARRATGQTESGTSGEAKVILLTDVVEEPSLHADSFDALIGEADPRSALRALARARLPELQHERGGLLRYLFTAIFGGGRRSTTQQLRALLRDLSSVNDEATRFITSANRVDEARLRTTSAPLTVAAEEEKTRLKIARFRSKRAAYEVPSPTRHPSPPTKPSPPSPASPSPQPPRPDAVHLADLEAALRLIAKENREAIDLAVTPIKTALDDHQRTLNPRIDAALATLGDVVARVAALEAWTHTASESQQIIVARLEEGAAESAVLAEQVEALQSPAVLRARQREQELADADHQVELARKRAEVSAHQATARRHRERPKTPIEEFAQRAREQLRTATSKRRTLDKIRREIDERLRQTAERHGEDSDAYKLERDMYDDLTTDLEELK